MAEIEYKGIKGRWLKATTYSTSYRYTYWWPVGRL